MGILILSKELDTSTDEVMEWIRHFGGEVIRVNIEDLLNEKIIIDLDEVKIYYNDIAINLLEHKIVWNRKWTDHTPIGLFA